MNLDNELINHISHLARLNFEGEELVDIQKDMTKIVSFMEKLNEIDTEGIEPLVFMSDEINVLREDVPKVTISQKEALLNAPKKDSDYFRIPKVLNK